MDGSLTGNKHQFTGIILSRGKRFFMAASVFLLLLMVLAGVLAIPFLFESPTMWYKFGIEKTSLRAGKMLGLAAGLLLLLQLPLAGRLKTLDRIFSLPGLMRWHRRHAWIIVLTALVHPVCILLPEGKLLVPLELRYWPEWVGVALLITILVQFACSRWRWRLKIAFDNWMRIHRIVGLLITVLLIVHVLYVSETFDVAGPPRTAVLIAAGSYLLAWLWTRTGWLRARRWAYSVSRVDTAGTDCTCVELTPSGQSAFSYAPGQFAFVSFRSVHVSPEPHAFTLSSTPSRPGTLQFTIRASGDWTRSVKNLSKDDGALIQGPFGRFGHLFTTPGRELILIAGGIGITPMLSMLRFMADGNDARPVTLIWSNRSREQVVFVDEMDALATKLTGLRRVPIFTRITENGKPPIRLNRAILKTSLIGCSRQAAVFVCGPPQMMAQAKSDLKQLGFSTCTIFSEEFGL